ncbi:bifunctional 2-keto-4-hydroxyglutarate aldolase/2-keto-3-deoxy-6-phosphogluconate aldolase [Oscillospiraceae bacterium]|nr:bifunctional 2-keto-4-hydroxyglutarate aldolase/2-keto-3-deoxy-6-phosphogluconate aldolase [Oscillospiraceae bacterium]BDF76250.1 bifunctional 2-keto-4-hydroxyglutarate aldolase/2-keto-3-deoxy-6-phosphogluconate aldolase [Oscillospiraceae bacterium]
MNKWTVLDKITGCGLVAVVRAENEDQGTRIAEACAEGGVAGLEITYTVPGASAIIESLAKRYQGTGFIVGAGTVLDPETARTAILAGAQYVVSPGLSLETIRLCNRYAVPVMPGVMTVTEAVAALEAGADILKLFPGDAFGPGMIKALKGPLPQVAFMPTGGVDADNVDLWIKSGAAAVGAGSSLTKGARTGDYAQITATARIFLEKIRAARA